MDNMPLYACAIISDPRDRLLLQLRPAGSRFAADQLTCFGGRREPGEELADALVRECIEELGLRPPTILPACDLIVGQRAIAHFFHCPLPSPLPALRLEPGFHALWAPWSSLAGLPLSPWHAAVCSAWHQGAPRVELEA